MLSQLVCKRSCFDGSPFSGRALVKEVHYSGRPQVHTIYACGFTANKVQIKRSLNLLTVNTMCTDDFRKSHTSHTHPQNLPCPQPPIPTLVFFSPFFAYGLTACERCEMIHEDTWWHIISVLIRSGFLFLFCFLFSISRYDLCNMWQM